MGFLHLYCPWICPLAWTLRSVANGRVKLEKDQLGPRALQITFRLGHPNSPGVTCERRGSSALPGWNVLKSVENSMTFQVSSKKHRDFVGYSSHLSSFWIQSGQRLTFQKFRQASPWSSAWIWSSLPSKRSNSSCKSAWQREQEDQVIQNLFFFLLLLQKSKKKWFKSDSSGASQFFANFDSHIVKGHFLSEPTLAHILPLESTNQ